MIKNFKFKIKNSSTGVTLIEIVVVIAIIVIFTMMVIADFPTIEKQSALSGATYKLEQDIRKAEDLGLSGVIIKDASGNPVAASGYGIYIVPDKTEYLLYADVKPDSTHLGDSKYNGNFSTALCSSQTNWKLDCVIQVIDISKQNSSLSISDIGTGFANASINFVPPNPTTTISADTGSISSIDITLSNGLSSRKVSVNTSGLISLK